MDAQLWAAVAGGVPTHDVASCGVRRCPAQSTRVSLVQDLPISKPYAGPEIDELVQLKEVTTMCPYYLDVAPAQADLQAMVDRMKAISDVITLSTSKGVQVGATGALRCVGDDSQRAEAGGPTAPAPRPPLACCAQGGDLYADVQATSVQLGVQVCDLNIYPADVVASARPDRSVPVSTQLEDALAAGDAVSVVRAWEMRGLDGTPGHGCASSRDGACRC